MRGIKTGGRQKGAKNKAPAALQAEIAASGETPLNYMLRVMRTSNNPARCDDMAKAAAPYVHAKLASIEHGGKGGGAIQVVIQSSDADL